MDKLRKRVRKYATGYRGAFTQRDAMRLADDVRAETIREFKTKLVTDASNAEMDPDSQHRMREFLLDWINTIR